MKTSRPLCVSIHSTLRLLRGVIQKEILATLGDNVHMLHQAPIPAGIVSVLGRQLLALCYHALTSCTKMVSLQSWRSTYEQNQN